MITIAPITQSPAPNGPFIRECAAQIQSFYGPAAAAVYQQVAPARLTQLVQTNTSLTWEAKKDTESAGLLMASLHGDTALISCIHVYADYRGGPVEQALLEKAVPVLRAAGAARITVNFIPLCPLVLGRALADMDFMSMDKLLMRRSITAPPDAKDATLRLEPEMDEAAGACLAQAFESHPELWMDEDMHSPQNAYALIRRVRAGAYGEACPDLLRGILRDERLAGVLVGTQPFPGAAFIAHLGVAPSFRRQGLARTLLNAYHAACHAYGLTWTLLSVGAENPARRLYEEQGYHPISPIESHYWPSA